MSQESGGAGGFGCPHGFRAAHAVLLGSKTGRLALCREPFWLAGQAALLQLLEAKHGASLGGFLSVAVGKVPRMHAVWPRFLQR